MARNRLLDVSELFYSIQGESSYSGFPCVFIRLAGCNLRCSYCDTTYSYEEVSQKMDSTSIITYVDSHNTDLVEITGGEPLLQDSVYFLIDQLLEKKKTVLLETNGSVSLQKIPTDVCAIVDVKCPASDAGNTFLAENIDLVKKRAQKKLESVELKFVISDQNDFEWAKQFITQHDLLHSVPLVFSPVKERIEPSALAEMIIADQLPVRFQLQLHTILWPHSQRGV